MRLVQTYFVRLVLLVLFAAGLVGCGRPKEEGNGASPRTSVTLLHYFTGSLSGGIEEMAQAFNRHNPEHELKAVSLDHEAFKTSIRDTLTSGHPPDLYSYWAGARTASIIEHLEPLDDLWQQAGLDQRFPPALIAAASTYEGHKYLLPITQHYIGFFYNRQLFDKHGLKPARTWDEFLALCAALKAKGITPIALGARDKWPAQLWFDYLLLRSEPYAFRQQLMRGEARFDDARVSAVFARWKTLIDRGYFNTQPHPNDLAWDSGANEMVFRGEAAMTLMGTWVIGYFSNDAHRWQPGRDFDFFPFPTIAPDVPPVALGGIDGLVLPRRAINPVGAKKVLAHLADVEAQTAFSVGSGALAPNQQVPLASYNVLQKRAIDEIARSPVFAFNFDLSTPPAVAELGLNAFSEFLAFPAAYPQIIARLADDAAKRQQGASPSP